jgi:hypothetical protein
MTASLTALTFAATLGVNAQTPQTPQTPTTNRPTTQQPMTRPADTQARTPASADQAVTVTGCLKDEKDVAGRQPNAAERAGIGNDYVLTNVKMSQGSATSGIGLASMYQVKGISESELKNHVGHQVEITGKLEAAKADATSSPNSDLPDLTASAVKMVSATCPAQ